MSQKMYKFQIVQFSKPLNENGQDQQALVDCVPSEWVYSLKKKLFARYPSPPYTPIFLSQLRKKIEKNEEPSSDWPLWEVNLRGGANTYKEAEKRLSILNKKLYAVSTDTEHAEGRVRSQRSNFERDALKDLMNLPAIETDSSESSINTGKNKYKRQKTQKQYLSNKRRRIECDNSSEEDEVNALAGGVCVSPEPTLSPLGSQHQSTVGSVSTDHNMISKEVTVLLKAIAEVKEMVLQLDKKVDRMLCNGDSVILDSTDTLAEFQVTMPISTWNDFKIFDEKLSDKTVAHKFILYIKNAIDRRDNNVSKSMSYIFRKIFCRELALKFTAIKQMPGKFVFIDTNVYICIKELLQSEHRGADGLSINDRIIHRALGLVLSNVRDWDGHRTKQDQTINKTKQ